MLQTMRSLIKYLYAVILGAQIDTETNVRPLFLLVGYLQLELVGSVAHFEG